MYKISDTPSAPVMTVGGSHEPNTITFYSAGKESLKISDEGFWINGHLVDDTDENRKRVYESFKGWLIYQRLLQK